MLVSKIKYSHSIYSILFSFYFTFFSLAEVQGLEVSQERKALSEAIEMKNAALVKSIMESYSIDVDALSKECKTPLMESAYHGDLASVRYFIGKGANVNFKEAASQDSPLKNALANFSRKGDDLIADILQALVDAGAYINEPIFSWHPSSFMIACSENGIKCVQIFIDAGVNLEEKTKEGKTALMFAVEKENVEIASFLIEKGVKLESKDSKGKTALFYAISNSQYLVSVLIGAGANINARDFEGTTPFMVAVASGKSNLIELFLQLPIDFKAINYQNRSALSFVAQTNDIQTASLLLEKGLEIDQKATNGYTPLLEAVHANKTEMAKFLIARGANATIRDSKGISAVYPAAKNGNLKLLQLLIAKQALLDTPDSYGFTPLMEAIVNDHFYIVECLLASGANQKVYTTSSVTITIFPSWKQYSIPYGTTPLELAKILGRTNIAALLNPKK